jgi:hypothetical protein
MRRRYCATCLWFCPKPASLARSVGDCRRHAPREGSVGHGWPGVFAVDFCGEHVLDETTLPPPRRAGVDPDGDGLPAHDPATCEYCKGSVDAA